MGGHSDIPDWICRVAPGTMRFAYSWSFTARAIVDGLLPVLGGEILNEYHNNHSNREGRLIHFTVFSRTLMGLCITLCQPLR